IMSPQQVIGKSSLGLAKLIRLVISISRRASAYRASYSLNEPTQLARYSAATPDASRFGSRALIPRATTPRSRRRSYIAGLHHRPPIVAVIALRRLRALPQ